MKSLSHGQLGALVKRAQQGDQEAFAILYAATVEHQLYFATAFLKDASLAEDVVQEVYLSLYRSLDKLGNPRLFVAYLNRICYNACVKHFKKRSRHADELDEEKILDAADPATENNPEERYALLEQNSELLSALSGLPDQHRSAFLMRYYHNMKIRAIVLSMDCSECTVKRYISAATQQLKSTMQKNPPWKRRMCFLLCHFLCSVLFPGCYINRRSLPRPVPKPVAVSLKLL